MATRRLFLKWVSGSVTSAVFLGGKASEAHAKPRPRQPKPQPKPKPKPKPRPKPKPKKPLVKRGPPVRKMDKKTTTHGRKVLQHSMTRGRGKAHPMKHSPKSRAQLKKSAEMPVKRAREKKRRGQPLSKKEKRILRHGRKESAFNDKRTMQFAAGKAQKDAAGALRALKPGQSLAIDIPFAKPIGKIHNTKTGRTVQGKTARVVFAKDKNGPFIKTMFVQR